MSELKPCPFGSTDIEPADRGLTVFCGGTYYSEEAEMDMEYCYSVPVEVFRNRPTEDALRDENERLKGRLTKLCDMCDEVESKYGCFTHRIPEFVDAMAEQSDKFEAENDRLQKRVGELEGLLRVAKCPDCDGSGVIMCQVSCRQTVSHEMAMDACCPEMEGSIYTDDDWEPEQCEWCDRKNEALTPPATKEGE